MLAVSRLTAGRKLPLQLKCISKPDFLQLSRHVTLKPVTQPIRDDDHDDHNLKLKRPQSPHLSIYEVQLPSTLSISHRMTGAALSGYTVLLGTGALVLPHKISYYIEALQAFHPGAATILALKFILAFPFAYHFCNGIRHLVWDAARYLSISAVYKTGYIMLACTVLLTAALLFI